MQICHISRFLFICLCFCFFVPVAYAQNNAEVSISGTLLMLDDATPHVAVVVQAVTPAADGKGEPQVVATTLSDEAGKYQFTNLKPGRYQVRCYTGNGYVYYTLRQDPDGIVGITEVIFGKEESGDILRIEPGETPLSVDFRFPPFKKGTWKNYTLI
ncbi:MAG: SdrD B-like domain-containing protein, partial [Candidatus Poribacteria bacterium]